MFQINKINRPSDVQREIAQLKHDANYHWVNSAVRTLDRGEANCLEAGLVAAFLMKQLGYDPVIMSMLTDKKIDDGLFGVNLEHVVYIFKDGLGYLSLGKSRYPELESREKPFPTVKELARSYIESFEKYGIKLLEWGQFDLREAGIDWERASHDISKLNRIISKKTEYHQI